MIDRRKFLEIAIGTGASSVALHFLGSSAYAENLADASRAHYGIEEWIAVTPATHYRPYMCRPAATADATSWVQVDLGSIQSIDSVLLEPTSCIVIWPFLKLGRFPLRFKLSSSDTPGFEQEHIIADCTGSDMPDPQTQVTEYRASGAKGRYVRLTVMRMAPISESKNFAFSVSRMVVQSGGRNIALQCLVTADPVYGNIDDLMQLTRPARPMGEGIVTDNPSNVISQSSFRPAIYKANVPRKGVSLNGGLFQTAMAQNIKYLLNSFSVDQLLRQFRERAGKPNPPDLPKPDKFWEEELAGSNAGRFLMGAGNTLRWVDHPELRERLSAVVAGIEECKQSNGYIMAYPEDTIFVSERGAYTRSWLTHGLIEAGYSGNPRAFELLRGYYDWYDNCKYLPQLLRRATMGPQGMVANTRMYFTPVGKPEDIQVIMRYFQENYWLDMLANQKDEAVWQYPYDRPHCYEITYLEAYLDLYRATGEKRYLNAMIGAWQLFHDNWEYLGGSFALEEFVDDPPRSLSLDFHHGELCGSSFWTFFNQRLHLLYPEEEKYMAEIEKSIYNVGLANQDGTTGIRYFAHLIGPKASGSHMNTCCEGQGTRLLGSLPEHIYSLSPDGFYVNLFEASTLSWEGKSGKLKATMQTEFPFAPEVQIHFAMEKPMEAKVRVRVPSWATGDMILSVNHDAVATGHPGTYVTLDRTWSDSDTISFTLPARLRLRPYRGSQVVGQNRYCLEYGPILMAAVGANDVTLKCEDQSSPDSLIDQLKPIPGMPLHYSWEKFPHFTWNGKDQIEFMPYLSVDKQDFSCVPILASPNPANQSSS